MAPIIVRLPGGDPRAQWQQGLRAVQRLDLTLLIDGEDHGIRRRIRIQADDIADFVDELRIGRELERLDTMGLQAKRSPDPPDRTVAQARGLGHRPGTPVRFAWRRGLQRLDDHRLNGLVGDRTRRTHTGLVVQPVHTLVDKLTAPFRDRRFRRPKAAGDYRVRGFDAGHHNARAKRDRAIDPRTVSQADQFRPFTFGDHNFGSWPSDSRHAAVRSHMRPFLLENSVPGGLARRWSFSGLLDELARIGEYAVIQGILHSYAMSSHLIHQDGDAIQVIAEREERGLSGSQLSSLPTERD